MTGSPLFKHATAIQNLRTHLRDHHAVPADERTVIMEKYSGCSIKKPGDVGLPPPMRRPFEALGNAQNAFQCVAGEECGYITVNTDAFRKHCKKEHGIPWKEDTDRLFERVKVQTFFRTGEFRRYITVRVPDHTTAGPVSAEKKVEVKDSLREWQGT